MSPGTIALIVVAVSVVAWAMFMLNVTVRRERKAAAATAPSGTATADRTETGSTSSSQPESSPDEPGKEVTVEKVAEKQRKPLTSGQLAVSRRQFLNRAWTASFSAFLGFFGMATLSFLWPKLTGGFGTTITVGDQEELLKQIGPEGNFKPLFVPEGRFWLTYYEGTGDAPVYLAVGAVEAKMQALYRKCVHLGCSVPHCEKSSLFECPCHGSKYRLSGEFYGGPAPRGLDRFPISISGGKVVVDTGDTQIGPPRGTNTWDAFSEPQGDLCVPT
ncbi:MAG: ubiquinol-cytochrome c reductase iron-sulfur subunit [Actinomycetota bacterium]|nr:ubiquinol-cytochrome c reductase iron-sulfur subunit [Actinomycetota bacterium]